MTPKFSPSRIRRRLALALLTASIIPAVIDGHAARATATRADAGLGPHTAPLAAPPAPIPAPQAPLDGDVAAVDLRDGRPLRMAVERRGREVRVRQSDGCAWSRRGDWFTPSLGWSGCGGGGPAWRDGAAAVRAHASLWPMRLGAEGRWRRQAVSASGLRFERETVCRVVAAEAVIREGRAPTPAWRVTCDDGGVRTLTTWYAPGEGPVAHVRRHATHGVEQAWVRS